MRNKDFGITSKSEDDKWEFKDVDNDIETIYKSKHHIILLKENAGESDKDIIEIEKRVKTNEDNIFILTGNYTSLDLMIRDLIKNFLPNNDTRQFVSIAGVDNTYKMIIQNDVVQILTTLNMRDQRVTEMANGVLVGDAVNKGQLDIVDNKVVGINADLQTYKTQTDSRLISQPLQLFKGNYNNYADLVSANPTGVYGDYAWIDQASTPPSVSLFGWGVSKNEWVGLGLTALVDDSDYSKKSQSNTYTEQQNFRSSRHQNGQTQFLTQELLFNNVRIINTGIDKKVDIDYIILSNAGSGIVNRNNTDNGNVATVGDIKNINEVLFTGYHTTQPVENMVTLSKDFRQFKMLQIEFENGLLTQILHIPITKIEIQYNNFTTIPVSFYDDPDYITATIVMRFRTTATYNNLIVSLIRNDDISFLNIVKITGLF